MAVYVTSYFFAGTYTNGFFTPLSLTMCSLSLMPMGILFPLVTSSK